MQTDGRARILVVDDAPTTLEVVERSLSAEGHTVLTAPGVSEAIGILESTAVDLVITDLKMPGASGLELIHHVRDNLKDTEVMMITGYASVEGAVEAVKNGADEYLAKPFTTEELAAAVSRSLQKLRARQLSTGEEKPPEGPRGLIGQSAAIRAVYRAIEKAAASKATMLIVGESGTGKELVARAIHYQSKRAAARFVPVNCGAIPESLLESELFGHVKGAFTGATSSRAGFFQTADGGTIFLDEVSEMSLPMQVRLLRVLQEKEVYMVGSSRVRTVDVRVLAATNKDLQNLVSKGVFREDLFFRLNVLSMEVPPVRDRGDDILLLIKHFASQYASELDRTAPDFSERALDVLQNYHWPGNVREIENVIQRMIVMCDGDLIEAPDLPSLMRFNGLRSPTLMRPLTEVEAEHIRNVLAYVDGNKTKAASILGIDRKTLRQKLKKIGEHVEA